MKQHVEVRRYPGESLEDLESRILDALYTQQGPCCAGCDWWRYSNAVVGECIRSAPVPGEQRIAMLGITGSSLAPAAGHIMTLREHVCGEFKDEFDWSTLPAQYLRRIGRDAMPAAVLTVDEALAGLEKELGGGA